MPEAFIINPPLPSQAVKDMVNDWFARSDLVGQAIESGSEEPTSEVQG